MVAQINLVARRRRRDGHILAPALKLDGRDQPLELAFGVELLDDAFRFGGIHIAIAANAAVHWVTAASEVVPFALLAAVLAECQQRLAVAIVLRNAMLAIFGHIDTFALGLHVHLSAASGH